LWLDVTHTAGSPALHDGIAAEAGAELTMPAVAQINTNAQTLPKKRFTL
jgi:hypothetical protein